MRILSFYTSIINQNHMCDSWDMEHNNFFWFWTIFCPFTHPPSLTTKRMKILKRWKKTPRDIIILHKCTINTINDNHMIYGSWDINCNRQIFFVILDHFLPFYPKIMIICYTIPEVWHVADVIVIFNLWLFFTLLPP